MSLPIAWVLKDKHILLVGGGDVAETRVRKIVDEGCHLVVVAPKLTPYIQELADTQRITWVPRKYESKDLKMQHWSFVLTAIDDHETSEKIAHACRAKHIPVNVADVIPLCDFYFGANFQQGPLKVMVSTGSGAPRLSKRVLNELSSHASKFRYGDAITNVSKLRKILRNQLPENHPKVSQVRMALMKSLCDRLTFTELAELKEEEMAPLVRGMLLSTAACPAMPAGDIEFASDFVDAPGEDPISRDKKSNETNGETNGKTDGKAKDLIKDQINKSDSSSNSGSDSGSDSDSDSDSDSGSGSDSDSESNSDRESENNSLNDSGSSTHPKRMKRKATECATGYPRPKLPSFPFEK